VLLLCRQPLPGSQLSVVQGFESLHDAGGPALHAPPAHTSPTVQALPSLHANVLLALTQPLAGLQLSLVHPFESSQSGGGPPLHAPPPQVSLVVQALPSLHAAVLLVLTQPLAGLQLSVVQAFESLHDKGEPPLQTPPPQVSLVVQALPSLQGIVLLAWAQPVAGLQLSVVQIFESLHERGAPPLHTPPPHVSLVVQALPSSQGCVLGSLTQPEAGSQESVVQPLPSLHTGGAPPTHVPPEQVSVVVQAFPSSQLAVFALF
jgi:hypothetical protein